MEALDDSEGFQALKVIQAFLLQWKSWAREAMPEEGAAKSQQDQNHVNCVL